MAGEAKLTTDHKKIKKWVEQRNGKPSTVKSTKTDDEAGILRIVFQVTVVEIHYKKFPGMNSSKNLIRKILLFYFRMN